MLALISITTGCAAGIIALVRAKKLPEQRKQHYGLPAGLFGFATRMAVVFVF